MTYWGTCSAQLEADFDHINWLNDAGGHHSTGATIEEWLDGGPYCGLISVCHHDQLAVMLSLTSETAKVNKVVRTIVSQSCRAPIACGSRIIQGGRSRRDGCFCRVKCPQTPENIIRVSLHMLMRSVQVMQHRLSFTREADLSQPRYLLA